MNKSKFVRDLPESLSAAAVIERGKAQGIALTDRYIYSIRSKHRANGGAAPKKRGRPVGSTSTARGDAREAQFVDLAVNHLGLQKSEALLSKLRSAVAA